MSRTQRYRQQHADLAALIVDLVRELNAATLKADAARARGTLAVLAGKVKLHLAG